MNHLDDEIYPVTPYRTVYLSENWKPIYKARKLFLIEQGCNFRSACTAARILTLEDEHLFFQRTNYEKDCVAECWEFLTRKRDTAPSDPQPTHKTMSELHRYLREEASRRERNEIHEDLKSSMKGLDRIFVKFPGKEADFLGQLRAAFDILENVCHITEAFADNICDDGWNRDLSFDEETPSADRDNDACITGDVTFLKTTTP